MQDSPLSGRPRRRLAAARRAPWLIPLAAVLVYAGGVPDEFVHWDDDLFIQSNPHLESPAGLLHIWTHPFVGGDPSDAIRKYYPLTYTLHWIEHQLWGDRAAGYYVVNVLLHAANALLVFHLLVGLGAASRSAALAALLFALHPIQVPSVAWLAERKNLLSTGLVLLAFLSLLRYRRTEQIAWYRLTLLAFLGAMLSKTAAISALGSLLLADWLVLRTPLRSSLGAVWPLALIAVPLAWITSQEESSGGHTYAEPLPLRPLAAAAALWFYVGKLVWPVELKTLYPRWNVTLSVPWVLPLIGLAASAAAIGLWRRRLGGLTLWGLGHFVLCAALALGLTPFGYLVHAPVADHFIYLSSIGLFAVVGIWLPRALELLPGGRTPALLGAIAVVGLSTLSVMTWQRSGVYRDRLTFWKHTCEGAPGSRTARHHLARVYHMRGQYPQAEALYRQVLADDPDFAPAENNLGKLLLDTDRVDEAVGHLEAAVRLAPDMFEARLNLGVVLMERGELDGALEHLTQAVQLGPGRPEVHRALGELYRRLGRTTEARHHLQRARELEPALRGAPQTSGPGAP